MDVRPIDADAVLAHVDEDIAKVKATIEGKAPYYVGAQMMYIAKEVKESIKAYLDAAPTLDCAPVRHGEWTLVEKFFPCGEEGEVDSDWYLVCSECGREVPVYEYWPPDIDIEKLTEEYPYCHCGAKMDGGKAE